MQLADTQERHAAAGRARDRGRTQARRGARAAAHAGTPGAGGDLRPAQPGSAPGELAAPSTPPLAGSRLPAPAPGITAQIGHRIHAAAADQADLAAGNPSTEGVRLCNLATALEPELTTSRERKQFLDAQNADLNEAMTTLEDAIQKIDGETRDLLGGTFNHRQRALRPHVPQLFGGGNARLVMTGDEILDAGVQVMAQPPGKKNSTIHLLSGGEKALTAIALVFAIFQLNPAPFCLLDEVDAPLDDANTERYAKLVTEMSQAGHAVPVHQPQQDRDGDGRAVDRRDHAGAGRLAHRGGGHGNRAVAAQHAACVAGGRTRARPRLRGAPAPRTLADHLDPGPLDRTRPRARSGRADRRHRADPRWTARSLATPCWPRCRPRAAPAASRLRWRALERRPGDWEHPVPGPALQRACRPACSWPTAPGRSTRSNTPSS
jgi:hypothetical protein